MQDSTIDTIGCDLGDKSSELFLISADGRTHRSRVLTRPEAMRLFFARPTAHVVIEVGPHSRWVSELLKDLGHEVTVANPRRVKAISQGDSKSDRKDAELLARLGRADRALLAPVEHRGAQAHADLEILKARDLLVTTRTQLINHVRSVVKCSGFRLPRCTAETFAKKTRELIPDELRAALECIYTTLAGLETQIRALEKTITRELPKRYPATRNLRQVNGVGPITAVAFVLTLEKPENFPRSRAVGAFLGLRPRQKQSGKRDPALGITKSGDGFLRRLLVQCANYILGPFGKDSDLRRWGLKLAERGGKNARKRAKIAVARKLGVLLHRLWSSQEEYIPIGYGQQELAA